MAELDTGETIFSFSDGLPQPPDRRTGPRYTTLLRVGVLETDAGKELCLIRNISAGGLMAHVYSSIREGSRAVVELKSGHQVCGKVMWAQEATVGIQFDEPIDVAEILTACADGTGSRRPRMPRIEIECFASVRLGARTYRARTIDISQGGVKLQVDAELPPGEVVVTMTGLGPLHGLVRWCDGAVAGIAFNQVMPLGELINWLKERQKEGRKSGTSAEGIAA